MRPSSPPGASFRSNVYGRATSYRERAGSTPLGIRGHCYNRVESTAKAGGRLVIRKEDENLTPDEMLALGSLGSEIEGIVGEYGDADLAEVQELILTGDMTFGDLASELAMLAADLEM